MSLTCSGRDIPASRRSCLLVAVHQTFPRTHSPGSCLMLCQSFECQCICVCMNKYTIQQLYVTLETENGLMAQPIWQPRHRQST